MSSVLVLGAKLDSRAISGLAKSFEALTGDDITLDAGGVEHLGARGLEFLVSAQKTAQSKGTKLTLKAPSDALLRDLDTMGIAPDFFESQE